MAKRKEYELNINIDRIMDEIERLCVFIEDEETLLNGESTEFITIVLQPGQVENIDTFNTIGEQQSSISAVSKLINVMPKQDYSEMHTTTELQRELILEVIHRLHMPDSSPLQIFFGGPAGCG